LSDGFSAASASGVSVALSDWRVHPVLAQDALGQLRGGLLWPGDWSTPLFRQPQLDSVEAVLVAADGLVQALSWLEASSGPVWVAVPLPSVALMPGSGLLKLLSRRLADLAAMRERAGRRLVLLVLEPLPSEGLDLALMRNLAELHQLAITGASLVPDWIGQSLTWPVSMFVLGSDIACGIDASQEHQRQWRFAAHGAQAIGAEVVIAGVETDSELAWLRRQGCRLASGPAMAPSVALGRFGSPGA
jgi:hypothetical protein